MRKRTWIQTIGSLITVCALALAGCGGGATSDSDSSSGETPVYDPITAQDFLTANGSVLQNENGETVQLRGTNFGGEITFESMRIYKDTADYTRAYKLYAYLDGEWRTITRGEGQFGVTEIDVETLTTTKVRLEQTGSAEWNHWSIYDLAFFG